MVRKRGGTTGQGGGKRQATTPVGGTYKDSRRNIQGDEDYDDEDQWTQVIHSKQKSPTRQSGSGSGQIQLNQPDNTEKVSKQKKTEPSIIDIMNMETSERGSIAGTIGKKKNGSVIDELNERASLRGSVAGSLHNATTTRMKSAYQKGLGEDSLYKTPSPDGCMRDVLTVEVQTRDRDNFRGTVTYNEAKYEIFMGALDLPESLLHGIKIQFGSGPMVVFKLTEQIDIDTLSNVEYFEFERKMVQNGEERVEHFGCQLKGIRQRRPGMTVVEEEDEETERNVFDVTVSGCDYSVEAEEILEWLNVYGETFGKMSENVYLEEELPSAKPTGNGTYTVKMRLDRPIPQFLPMYGKKVRVDHRSQHIMCTNCYGRHPRKVCKSEKVPWMDYVVSFMRSNENVTNNMIGRWFDIAKQEKRVPNERSGNTDKTKRNVNPVTHGTTSRQIDPAPSTGAQHEIPRTKRTEGPERQEKVGKPTNVAPPRQTVEQSKPSKKYVKSPEKMAQILAVREQYDDRVMLTKLTSLGLSVEAAVDMRAQEKKIAQVYEMLKNKDLGSHNQSDQRNERVEKRVEERDNDAFEW